MPPSSRSTPRREIAFSRQLGVAIEDHPSRDAEILSELAARGQGRTRCQPTGVDRRPHGFFELPSKRGPAFQLYMEVHRAAFASASSQATGLQLDPIADVVLHERQRIDLTVGAAELAGGVDDQLLLLRGHLLA